MTEKQPNPTGQALLSESAKLEVLRVALALFIRMQPPETRTTFCNRLTQQIAQWQELGIATTNPEEYLDLLGHHAAALRALIEE